MNEPGMTEPGMIDVALKGSAGAFALDAAFSVPAAGITAIWGPSGAGKTTLLRAIAGLTRLDGRVVIGPAVWQDERCFVPVHKRRVGYVFQEPSLLAHLTVAGNLTYGMKRIDGDVDFDGTVERLGIEPLLGRSVARLSGGERQRVALARTLLAAPEILLMDEPLSSLDSEAKAGVIPLIAAIGRQLPVLYVSHDAYEIERLADRTLRMAAGRMVDATTVTFSAQLDGLSDTEVRALAAAALKAGLRV